MREMSGKKTLIHNAVYTVNHSVVMNTITNVNKVIFLKKGKKIYTGYMYVQAVPVDFLTS